MLKCCTAPILNNNTDLKLHQSLQCPFWVMSDGPYMGKLRSRDLPWQQVQLVISITQQLHLCGGSGVSTNPV